MEMTWEQKLAAICVLNEAVLIMRKPGDWYVDQRSVEKSNGRFAGGISGNGSSPEEAVHVHWNLLTEDDGRLIIVNGLRPSRKAYKWNEFMWVEVEEIYATAEAARKG